jgi:hypothetical protein
MGYGYVGQLLAALDTLLESPEYAAHFHEAIPLVLPAIPEDYFKSHSEIASALDECIVFDQVFEFGKKLHASSEGYEYIRATMQAIVLHFINKRLTTDRLRKYRGKEEAGTLAEILARYEPDVRAQYPPHNKPPNIEKS